jgi:hypothetical protein
MKPKHLKKIEELLPGSIPKINQLLADEGMPGFKVKILELTHEADDPCNGSCGEDEICDQKLVNGVFVPFCRPKLPGE